MIARAKFKAALCSVWFAYLSYLFQHREYKCYTLNKWPRLKAHSTMLGAFLLFSNVKCAFRRFFWKHSTLLFCFLNFLKVYFQNTTILKVSKVPNVFIAEINLFQLSSAPFLSLKIWSFKVGVVFSSVLAVSDMRGWQIIYDPKLTGVTVALGFCAPYKNPFTAMCFTDLDRYFFDIYTIQ